MIPREAGELLAVLEKTGTFPPEIQAKVEGLAERIIALSPKPAEPDVDFVPRLVSSLGLNHPRSSVQEDTARLWSEIIRSPHIHSQHGVDKESLRILTESTARIFESVESLQTLNQETNRMEQTLFFSFPLFWPGENGKGELAFKRPQEKKTVRPRGTLPNYPAVASNPAGTDQSGPPDKGKRGSRDHMDGKQWGPGEPDHCPGPVPGPFEGQGNRGGKPASQHFSF